MYKYDCVLCYTAVTARGVGDEFKRGCGCASGVGFENGGCGDCGGAGVSFLFVYCTRIAGVCDGAAGAGNLVVLADGACTW